MVLGLRPESFIKGSAPNQELEMAIQVDLLEPTGPDVLVHGSWHQTPLTLRVPAKCPLTERETCTFHLPLEDLHIFSARDGMRLS